MSKAEGLGKFISTDNGIPDIFIEAPPEMLEKAMRPRGVFRDYDKPVEELTNEGKFYLLVTGLKISQIILIQTNHFGVEKAVFNVLVDSD